MIRTEEKIKTLKLLVENLEEKIRLLSNLYFKTDDNSMKFYYRQMQVKTESEQNNYQYQILQLQKQVDEAGSDL